MKKLTAIFISLIMVAAICVSSAILSFAEADATSSEATSSQTSSEGPTAHEPAEIRVSHVNRYSYGTFNAMIINQVGTNCFNITFTDGKHPDCKYWRAIKVDNVDGVLTVTSIQENGADKTDVVSEGGFILYVFAQDPDYAKAQEVVVGDVATLKVDISKDASSETPIGTITFASASSGDTSSEATSSEATSSEAASSEAASSEATPSVATSSADTSSTTPTTPSTGDAGVIAVVILAIVAALGSAVVVKARR